MLETALLRRTYIYLIVEQCFFGISIKSFWILYIRIAFDLALLSASVSQPSIFNKTDGLVFLLYFWNINLAALLFAISSL